MLQGAKRRGKIKEQKPKKREKTKERRFSPPVRSLNHCHRLEKKKEETKQKEKKTRQRKKGDNDVINNISGYIKDKDKGRAYQEYRVIKTRKTVTEQLLNYSILRMYFGKAK